MLRSNVHYKFREIQRRHFASTDGFSPAVWAAISAGLLESLDVSASQPGG